MVGNLYKVRILQKLYILSILTRLKAAIDARENDFLKNLDSGSKNDKIILVNYLINCLTASDSNSFLITKKKSVSFFLQCSDVNLCYKKNLYLESILPVLDSVTDRSNLIYRPYRYCQDILFGVKNILNSTINPLWFIQFELFFSFRASKWIFRNLPFSINNNCAMLSICNPVIKDRFFFILMNFLLDGLVRNDKNF